MDEGTEVSNTDIEAQREEKRAYKGRAVRSFENLVALANDAERFRDARKMVWRDRGEPAIELKTLEDCLRHALRGALRAGTLGFGIRAGFNLFLLLFRILRSPKSFRISLLLHAIFGEDSFRFGGMIGSFVAIYKSLLNALPLLDTPPNAQDSPTSSPPADDTDKYGDTITIKQNKVNRRLSSAAQAHQEWVRKRTKRWHAIAAGGIAGGIGVLFEKPKRRATIAQQLFVRGLQAAYNEFTTRHNIRVPFGPVIVFSLCCGQIMYAWLLRPDTIPPSYSEWIRSAGKIRAPAVRINRSLVRDGKFDFADMQELIDRKDTHELVRPILAEAVERAWRFGDFGPRCGSCAVVHPSVFGCTNVPFDRFFGVARSMFPIYGALHFIPILLFKRIQVFKEPLRMLTRAFLGTARSSAFLATFIVVYQAFFCFKYNLHTLFISPNTPFKLSQKATDLFIGRLSFWLGGLLSGFSLLVEAKHRRPELAMYVLPKGLESAWRVASGKGIVYGPKKYGEALLCAFGMGMVMNSYQHNPQHLSGLVRRILYQFIGPN